MSLGIPIALQTIPVQKSTFGYNFRFIKYSSANAYFSRFIASSNSGPAQLSSITFRTEQHIFCIIVARGSKFLQTLWPKPINLKLEFLSLDFAMTSAIEDPSLCIYQSMLRTAQLAPPWYGPQSEPMPAAMQAQGLACELPAMRTVEVEAFCSCSAWQIQITSIALNTSSAISNSSSIGLENIIQRKFFMQPNFFFGYTTGSPIAVRQAQAARVGILAISLMAISQRSLGLNRSSEWRKADRAPTTPTIMAIGCESLLKPLQNSIIFQFIIISPTTISQNFLNSPVDGKIPYNRRQHVSIQVECQASCQIGYPRQSNYPFSPLMQQMLEIQLAVHMKPGSYVRRLAFKSRLRTSIRSGPKEPRIIGSQYYWSPIFRIAFSGCYFGSFGVTRVRSCFYIIELIYILSHLEIIYKITITGKCCVQIMPPSPETRIFYFKRPTSGV